MKRKLLSLFLCLIFTTIVLSGCDLFDSSGSPNSGTSNGDGIITESEDEITRAEAYIMVVDRLNNLAQSYEAKEYVTCFLIDSASWKEYDEEIEAWGVGISPGPEGKRLLRQASWFNVTDESYFFDLHWDEPRPRWAVYDDGKIIPFGKAIAVEADIQLLNTSRALG